MTEVQLVRIRIVGHVERAVVGRTVGDHLLRPRIYRGPRRGRRARCRSTRPPIPPTASPAGSRLGTTPRVTRPSPGPCLPKWKSTRRANAFRGVQPPAIGNIDRVHVLPCPDRCRTSSLPFDLLEPDQLRLGFIDDPQGPRLAIREVIPQHPLPPQSRIVLPLEDPPDVLRAVLRLTHKVPAGIEERLGRLHLSRRLALPGAADGQPTGLDIPERCIHIENGSHIHGRYGLTNESTDLRAPTNRACAVALADRAVAILSYEPADTRFSFDRRRWSSFCRCSQADQVSCAARCRFRCVRPARRLHLCR